MSINNNNDVSDIIVREVICLAVFALRGCGSVAIQVVNKV